MSANLAKLFLGSRQRACWFWAGLSRKARREVLVVMTRDKSLTPAHRRIARRKLREVAI